MTAKSRIMLSLVAIAFLAASAHAQNSLTYTVSGTFPDGGTFSGSFDYDSVTNRYSNVNIVTTPGSVRTTGATYRYVCGQDVPTCTGVAPDATGYLNLTTTMGDQTGNPAMALFFGVPLDNFGKGDFGVGQGSPTRDLFAQEATCSNAACTNPASPARITTGGRISSSPTLLMFFFFN